MDTIIKAKTVEEAVAQGAKELGVAVDAVKFEVIEEAKKGFLGMFGGTATVRVYTEDGEAAVTENENEANEAAEEAVRDETAKESEAAYEESPAGSVEEAVLNFLNTLIADMGVDAKAAVKRIDEQYSEANKNYEKDIRIDIDGKGLGMLIGRHGDVLDALQYLCNIIVGRFPKRSDKHEYVRVILDIEGYRAKREETLKALTRRHASKVLATGRNYTLEPMSAYERRVIHSEAQHIEGVHTFSIGSENNRRVVIAYGNDVSETEDED